jgi:hypothetical protein
MGSKVALLALALPASVAVWAHHSAAQFDFGQTVRIEGVVKEMRVANPHIALYLEVKDDKGARVIEYEGHSRNNVYRRGWRPDMVQRAIPSASTLRRCARVMTVGTSRPSS